MKKLQKTIWIAIQLSIIVFINACSEELPDPDNCKINLSGSIIDAITEEPIDSIKVLLTPIIFLGQNNPIPGQNGETYSNAGLYSFDVNCMSDYRLHMLQFLDYGSNRYYGKNFKVQLKDVDYESEVVLCPLSFLSLNLTNQDSSDFIEFNFSGYQCDNLDMELGFISPRYLNSDTTLVWSLPISSELTVGLRSYKNDILQNDTTVIFSTQKGDTTYLDLNY